jgi:hypothetical protein
MLLDRLQPVGWTVGLIRVEDVAIGFAISLLVGLLFWLRGVGALLLNELAAAYARSADYVVATARRLSEGSADEAARAGRAADAALHRLDDAFRQYLAERSATAYSVEDVAALVGGAARVRRAAQSLAALGRATAPNAQVDRCARNLDGDVEALQASTPPSDPRSSSDDGAATAHPGQRGRQAASRLCARRRERPRQTDRGRRALPALVEPAP